MQSRLSVENSTITNEQLHLMRGQTEETTKQLEISTKLLSAMQRQSEEADKQSKTLLVFTVVTIVFVSYLLWLLIMSNANFTYMPILGVC